MINRHPLRQLNLFITAFITLLMSFSAFSQKTESTTLAKIKLTIDDQQVIVNLLDTPASHQLLALLPLTLTFSDYVGAEKIAYLPQRLITQGMASAAHISGDFTYYAPWGNLALFYQGVGTNSQLYTLGHIESGRTVLANLKQDFVATISRVE
ncbi:MULTISPECIES: cyclophilin-like fold protein [Gilliamella]|nr:MULTISPECIES: cyclophilin-like fold protein [Gilliamella]